jgi:pimeloyl-ACP methyl ester carboxylesterase
VTDASRLLATPAAAEFADGGPGAPVAGTTWVDDFRLADGRVVGLRLAYTMAGPRDAPAWLLLHGYTGSHYALAPLSASPFPAADAGWAAAWAGPGRDLDTRRVRVITVNLPGSSYGSTWDGTEPDAHDDAYATVRNMAQAIDSLLEQLGIERLAGAIGYSFGGYVAQQLKADHPHRVDRVLGLCTGWRGRGSADELPGLRGLTQADDRFAFRVATLMRAGLREWAADRGEGAAGREIDTVRTWASEFSAQSLWRLRAAAIGFALPASPPGTTLLYASSDTLFPPPHPLPEQAAIVVTPYGHQSLLLDPAAWRGPIARWLAGEGASRAP